MERSTVGKSKLETEKSMTLQRIPQIDTQIIHILRLAQFRHLDMFTNLTLVFICITAHHRRETVL